MAASKAAAGLIGRWGAVAVLGGKREFEEQISIANNLEKPKFKAISYTNKG